MPTPSIYDRLVYLYYKNNKDEYKKFILDQRHKLKIICDKAYLIFQRDPDWLRLMTENGLLDYDSGRVSDDDPDWNRLADLYDQICEEWEPTHLHIVKEVMTYETAYDLLCLINIERNDDINDMFSNLTISVPSIKRLKVL